MEQEKTRARGNVFRALGIAAGLVLAFVRSFLGIETGVRHIYRADISCLALKLQAKKRSHQCSAT
jgi:hypothetical protein